MLSRATPTPQKLLFWGAILLIGTVSSLSFSSTQRLQGTAQDIEQAQDVLLGVSRLMSSLKDVETGARNYLISGDQADLEPYRDGVARFADVDARLHERTRGNPELEDLVRRIDVAGRQRIEATRGIVDSQPRTGPTRDPQMLDLPGKAAMDRAHGLARDLVAREEGLLRDRREGVALQVQLTNIALGLGVLLSVASLMWLFFLRGRELDRRLAAEAELRALNADLEGRVQARTAELRRSRELLSAVLENLPDSVFLKDPRDEFRYLFVNKAAEKLLGRPKDELVGHLDHELFAPERADHCRRADREVTDSRRPMAREERQVAGAGARVLEIHKVPIVDGEGQPEFLLAIVRDITEQRNLEDQLRRMQRMDAVGQLSGGIAHDFNNLLTVIMNSAEVLKHALGDDPQMEEVADDTIGAVQRGSDLVRRLLAFARMQRLEPVSVNLNKRLSNITALLQRTLGERIVLRIKRGRELWNALIDPTQVDDAILNLAINARDAMKGEGALSIETRNVTLDEDYAALHLEVDAGDYVMLAVSDTGAGMTPEIISHAFEPFFTTKPPGMGTGLGLSQIYGWIKQSGGHIKIYSEPGHGTTVKLYLPRIEREAADASAGAVQPRKIVGGRETILVVEDNPNVRKALVRNLDSLGYRCLEAANGAEAMSLVRLGARFDLLFTDIVMPGGMTGYELAAAVRRLRPGQKVLFTSGYTELAIEHGTGSDPLLSKPYRKQELAQALRAILDHEDRAPGSDV
ncbi:MAG: CHASE3 domain-containing protein [Sphingomonadaceae bacterium]|nr:CHASE3 domain-containing protein [Sphingomonadaceae bacterium]